MLLILLAVEVDVPSGAFGMLAGEECNDLLDKSLDLAGLVVALAEVEAGNLLGAIKGRVARAVALVESQGFGSSVSGRLFGNTCQSICRNDVGCCGSGTRLADILTAAKATEETAATRARSVAPNNMFALGVN